MKRYFALLNLFLFLALPAHAAMEKFTLDPTHSYVQWHINHFNFSNPSGKWFVNGTVDFDELHPQDSKINITIPVANMVTGLPKLDEHLKNKDFFDTAKFPTATFVSDKIKMAGKNAMDIEGTLTVRGISKPVTLNATINKIAMSPITNKKTLGFTAQTMLKRSDFGMNAYLPGLSDEVKIEVEGEATLNSQ